MRILSAILVVCLLAAPLAANEIVVPGYSPVEAARANGIAIVGPATAEVGDVLSFRLTGTPPVDITLPLADQLDWAIGEDRMYCYVAAPGEPLRPLDVRLELVIEMQGMTLQPLLRVTPDTPGEYRVLVDWNFGQDQLAEHILIVGGEPDPNPIPPPPPPGDVSIVVIAETADRTAAQAATMHGLSQWMAKAGHPLTLADPDLIEGTSGRSPRWLTQCLADLQHRNLKPPVLMVYTPQTATGDFSVCVAKPLPATADGAIAIVRGYVE